MRDQIIAQCTVQFMSIHLCHSVCTLTEAFYRNDQTSVY